MNVVSRSINGGLARTPQTNWRTRNVALYLTILLAVTAFAAFLHTPPLARAENEAVPNAEATPKATPAPEEADEGFFSLSASRTYASTSSPRVWLDFRNMGEIDFRIYRLKDPAKFFRQLENKHQLGEEEKENLGKLRAPTILEWMQSFRDNLTRKFRNFVRSQIDWETRRDLNRYIDRKGVPVRRALNVADYARVPLLNPDQMVSSWREKLPEKVDENDTRMIPLGRRDPGVYLVEAVNGGLRAFTVVIVSDLALVHKTSPTGNVFVHTINRTDGTPRAGAGVEVVKNRQSVNYGTTDGNGNFQTLMPRAQPTPTPRRAAASTQEERSDDYLIMAQEGANFAISDLNPFGFNDEPTANDVNLRGFIYTERPIYRPTHTVSFKGIMRDLQENGYALLNRRTVTVTIEDEEENKLLNKPLPLSANGTFSGQVLIPATAKLGYYSVKASVGEETVYGSFTIEEYKKPEYKVSVNAPEKFINAGTKTRFQVEARYFFGAPVTNAEVKYYVYRSRYYPYWWGDDNQDLGLESETPDGDQYSEGDGYGSETVKEGIGTTDAQGRLYVDFDVPAPDAKQGGWDYQYRLEAQVTDSARRAIEASGTFVAVRGLVKALVNTGRYIYRQGETAKITVRASNYKGEPVAAPVRLQFVERTWVKVKKKSSDGSYEYDTWEPRERDLSSVNLTTGAQGEATYDYRADTQGYIAVRSFVTVDGKEVESLGGYLWIASRDEKYVFSYPNYGSITMVPDKKSYQPGETAKVLVMLPTEDANLLVTTELMTVMSSRTVRVKGRSAVLEIPIEARYAPNVFLNVSYVQDNELYTDDQMLAVPARDKMLDVTLIPDKQEYQPRETVNYKVITRNADGTPAAGAEVSIGVVDEAIYSIRGDYDNIKQEFYGRRYNQVDTNFSTSFYFQGYAGKQPAKIAANKKRPNSLADFKNESLVDPLIRKNFKDTAFWQPNVITGADGTATVAVKLPDNLTTWRATARAVTADTKVGATITRVLSRKSVIVRLATPRFVTAGDTVTLSGIVHNYLGSDKQAQVSLSVTGGNVLNAATQNVTVKRNGEQRIDWTVTAPQQSGELVLLAKALTTTESDAVQIKIPVNPRGLRQTPGVAATYSEDTVQQEFTLDIPADADQNARSLRLEAAPSVAATMFGALDYLTGYPYGCVEQTMSRFLPSVIVAQALKDIKTSRIESKDALDDKVRRGLERLYNMQHSDGGWGWWTDDETDPFMTAYVIDGLMQAKDAGYYVENSRIQRGRERLKQLLGIAAGNDQFDAVTRANTRAYMVYSHTISGDAEGKFLDDLFAQQDKLQPYGRALLALALAHRKDPRARPVAENIANTAVSNKQDSEAAWTQTWVDYKKQTRTEPDVEATALSLKALARVTPQSPLLPKIARWLVTHRRFGAYWDSTRQTAFVIYGLTDYVKVSKELTPDYTLEVYLNGQPVVNQRATSANAAQPFTFDVSGAKLGATNRVRVVKRGRGNLYFTGGLDYYAGAGDIAPAGTEALRISREYLRLVVKEENGKVTKTLEPLRGEVRSGDLLVSRLRVQGAPASYMMLEDPIPAGVEQVYNVGGINLDYTDKGWSDWYSAREFRDNRTVFFVNYFDGDATFQYALRVIQPGDFRLVPARAEMMYDPDVKANSESGALRIEDKK